jgi:hypothetical protein
MVLRIPNFRSFRVYIRRDKTDGTTEAVFVYWDTPDSRKALINPYLYEHAAHNDLEGRIIISRDSDADSATSKYLWGYFAHELDSYEVPDALGNLSKDRGFEFQKFLGSCYDSMFNNPSEPFRAVLSLRSIEGIQPGAEEADQS